VAAVITPGEEPVLAADGHAAQGVLTGVVVDARCCTVTVRPWMSRSSLRLRD
jgi:hypothetical protein